jgi:glutathione S-transferase
MAMATKALVAIDSMVQPDAGYLLLERLTQADVTAFVAERLARGLGVDTGARTPRLRELSRRLAEEPAFRTTEP